MTSMARDLDGGGGEADASVSSGKREELEAVELQCPASQRSQ